MTRPTRVAIWKVLLPTLYSQADGCYCCHRRKHNSVTSLVCVVTLLMVRSAMIPRKVPQSSHKVFLKCGNSERSQQCPGCCLSVTELSPASVPGRLNILEYHDLTPTLSRFSRYVWRAAGRRGPYAHICRGEPGGLVYTRSQCADISHSAEIPGNQNDEIVGVSGQAGRHVLTATIGRQAVGWPSSHCGSWNVKMVDGKPTQPRDSVFAASQVDCVCSMLTLPSDRRMPGAGWHLLTATSLRGQSHSSQSWAWSHTVWALF